MVMGLDGDHNRNYFLLNFLMVSHRESNSLCMYAFVSVFVGCMLVFVVWSHVSRSYLFIRGGRPGGSHPQSGFLMQQPIQDGSFGNDILSDDICPKITPGDG